jgi:alpha-mannosidase
MVAPMQRFVTIRDEKKSFTVITRGLPEYELKLDQSGVLALTLLRCVGKLSGRNLITRPGGAAGWWNETPDAQCQGTHTFEYAVLPGSADETSDWSSILKEVELYTAAPIAVKRKNNQRDLEHSFASIAPDSLSISALKIADDRKGIVLRICNPVDRTIDGAIHFESALKEAFRTNMNEEILASLQISKGHDLLITVKPFEVLTVLVRM